MAEKEGVVEDTAGAAAAVDDDEEDDAEEAAAAAAWTPPTEAEYKATLAKLNRSRTQAKTLREAAEAAKAAGTAATAAEGAPAGIDPKVLAQAQMRVVRTEAKARLLQEQIDPDMLDLALGLLRPSEIAFIGDDPDLDEWIDAVKDKHPKLFGAVVTQPQGRQPVGTVNQGAAATRTPKKLSFGEQVLAAAKAKR